MKKILLYMTFLCVLLGSMSITGKAADGTVAVTFDGEAQKFIQWEKDEQTFTNMMPDEQRIQTIHLTNDAHQEMRFYMSSKIQEALGEKTANGKLVYEISMQKDKETFFTGKIGGTEEKGKEYVGENFLLATLKEGESCEITLILRLDGNSMDNSYQGSEGSLDFRFSVEYDDADPVTEVIQNTPILNQIPGVNTGDVTNVYILFGLLMGSAAIMLIFVYRKKEKEKVTNR